MFPALAGRFLTTESSGKPVYTYRHNIQLFMMFSNFTHNSYSVFVNLFGRNMGQCKKKITVKTEVGNMSCNKLWEALNAVVEVWTLFSALQG